MKKPKKRRHVVGAPGRTSVLKRLDAVDRGLNQAQGALGLLITAEDRAEAPERTAYLDSLYSDIERRRRDLSRRAWKK